MPFIHFLKTILIPLSLAALLYLTLTHALLPFIRHNRTRYSHYLPLSLPSSDTPTPTSWRSTLSDALYNLFSFRALRRTPINHHGHEDELFSDEEGEGLVGFDPIDARRREALEQRRSFAVGGGEVERRLSRELEEGFRDESEEDEVDDREIARAEGVPARA